ncbi:S8 family serine peptidase, partial [Actinomadura sp. 7K507]|uniref:S8 family peptidase n=1 Tax=Actinomadura sp. 7K507 TaxID=2530365 RepID=UPI0010529740
MSEAGRRRPARARPATRLGARTTAALTALTLGAAIVVPAAIATGDAPHRERTVRGAAAGVLANAPTDQIRSREWHLQALRTTKAWKYTRGRGVTVAVLDTGVDKNHPDLTGQVITGPDLTGGVRPPGTRYWGLHGTSMASIISGHGHGPGLAQGMMGVAPQSRILSVRVTLENDDPLRRDNGQQDGTGDRDAVAQGIRYAVDQGAEIINMSLGGGRQFYNGTKSQESAIKYALGKGVVLIASAGNDGSGANRKNFPAAYPGVIAVGALDRRLRLWKDSNRRSNSAVCAPGVDIVSADASNGYVVGTGTSASSAMVAGVAALVRSRYPRLTPAEVRQALIQGSPARRGYPSGSSTCRGTVDALRTLYAAHQINKTSSGPVEAPPATPAPEPVAEDTAEDAGLLLPLVLGGGGVLVVIGLVLGWRQRGRREDDLDEDETDAVPDYGLPAAPAAARQPAGAAAVPAGPAAVAPEVAPVNAPLWQSTDVYQGPPPAPDVPPQDLRREDPSLWDGVPVDGTSWDESPVSAAAAPWDASPADGAPANVSWGGSHVNDPPVDDPPVDGSGDGSSWDGSPLETAPLDAVPPGGPPWGASWDGEGSSELDEPRPPASSQPPASDGPPVLPHDLRPFVPGEFAANGRNGQGPGNGHDAGNGHHAGGLNGTNGNGLNGNGLNAIGFHGSDVDGPASVDPVGFDDDGWEAFRRTTLDGPGSPESPTAAFPAVPPE